MPSLYICKENNTGLNVVQIEILSQNVCACVVSIVHHTSEPYNTNAFYVVYFQIIFRKSRFEYWVDFSLKDQCHGSFNQTTLSHTPLSFKRNFYSSLLHSKHSSVY